MCGCHCSVDILFMSWVIVSKQMVGGCRTSAQHSCNAQKMFSIWVSSGFHALPLLRGLCCCRLRHRKKQLARVNLRLVQVPVSWLAWAMSFKSVSFNAKRNRVRRGRMNTGNILHADSALCFFVCSGLNIHVLWSEPFSLFFKLSFCYL